MSLSKLHIKAITLYLFFCTLFLLIFMHLLVNLSKYYVQVPKSKQYNSIIQYTEKSYFFPCYNYRMSPSTFFPWEITHYFLLDLSNISKHNCIMCSYFSLPTFSFKRIPNIAYRSSCIYTRQHILILFENCITFQGVHLP